MSMHFVVTRKAKIVENMCVFFPSAFLPLNLNKFIKVVTPSNHKSKSAHAIGKGHYVREDAKAS